ncbi:MAG TPA: CheR family methyltransferase [Polyangiaceae bacterium]|nr:CheR family methyltransferase [Polyangiaceae bacterium]
MGQALSRVYEHRAEPVSELAGHIARSPELLHELAGHLTLSESYFDRHPNQVDAVMKFILPRIAEGKIVRIWSAGCARGEEPYTIAMKVFEAHGLGVMPRVQILGTDIDGASIKTAKSGRFTRWSLRSAPPRLLRHFEKLPTGEYQLRPALQGWVDFQHTSIQDHASRLAPQSLDVVLFRNVAIYLSREALRDIHCAFHRVLSPSGLLIQAATDPLPAPRWFHARSSIAPGMMRPAHPYDDGQQLPPLTETKVPVRRASDRLTKQSHALRPGKIATQRADSQPPKPQRALRSEPATRAPSQEFLLSVQVKLEQGDALGAITALRSALYLTPDDHLVRYWYCVALSAAAWYARALQQARQLKAQLSGGDSSQVLGDETTTIGELRQAVEEMLEELQ